MASSQRILSTILFIVCINQVLGIYIPPGPRYLCPPKAHLIYPCVCNQGTDDGLFIRCENTNLASLSIAINNIATLKMPVEELIIHKCNIEHLYGNMFYKVEARILKIHETPLKTINEHTFYGINDTLQELHIINTELSEFPKLAFKVLGNLTLLNISRHHITSLDKDIFADSLVNGKLERLYFINGNLSDLPIESFGSLRKLKFLDLHGNQLTVLKKNQFKNLRDIENLDLSFNKIAKLDSSHIADLTKLGFFNISNNALTELTRGTFARNSVLKVLNMSKNQIKRLDSNSFRGMRFMRRLYFSDNLITDIGRGTFGSVKRIGTIDLARNLLTKVDYQLFSQLNYVEELDVAENNITEIQKQSFTDLYLTRVNISHNSVSKIEPNAFENCANITILDLSFNLLTSLHRDTFDVNTYASYLQLSHNQLTDLSHVPLHNMTGLKVLNVSHNSITTIPKNTFPKLYELHTIDISYNNLSFIHNAVLQPLFSLRSLNLSYNSMEVIKTATFGTLPTLLEMDLSNNQLKELAKGGLTKLASLRHLNLENNMLEKLFEVPISLNHLNFRNNWLLDIPEKTWPVMNAMLSLDLSGNRLSDSLRYGSFAGLLVLQRLNLNSNGLTRVPWESLSGMSTLQYIHLESNNLTVLQKGAFGKLPVVFELNLYNNQISNISVKAFDGLLQLLTLNLSMNAIRTIPNEAFMGLVSLRNMDLSYNMMEKFDNKTNGVFDDCLSLDKLNLSHNKISFVTRKTFPESPWIPYRLREIDLSYNQMPVLTYDIIFGTKRAKIINLAHNQLNDIRRYILGNLTELETLDLSHNDLGDLTTEDNIFNLPENLTNLYMNNNHLFKMPWKIFEKAKNLKIVDFRGNQLENFDQKLVEKVKNGTVVLFEGNPVNCECSIRPLKHYLYQLTEIPNEFKNVRCNMPELLAGQTFPEFKDEDLVCAGNATGSSVDLSGDEYDVLPDLRFREISFSKSKLFIQWYVTAVRDIADFYIKIQDLKKNVLLERAVSYSFRSITIAASDIPEPSESGSYLQVCVQTKTSEGSLGKLFESQCESLPANMNGIKKKYKENYNYAYTILTTDKRRKLSTSSDGKLSYVINTKIIVFMLFLINAIFNYSKY